MGDPQSLIAPLVMEYWLDMASASPAVGCFVEVGVYQGGSAFQFAQLAEEQGRGIYLFDTFTGIPYRDPAKGDVHDVGDFNDTSFEEVCKAIPYATTVKGVFPGSVGGMVLPRVAFAHIDCDQYQSIVDTVNYLGPLMVPGGVMAFDDYGALIGATKAVEYLFPEERIELAPSGKAYVKF